MLPAPGRQRSPRVGEMQAPHRAAPFPAVDHSDQARRAQAHRQWIGLDRDHRPLARALAAGAVVADYFGSHRFPHSDCFHLNSLLDNTLAQ